MNHTTAEYVSSIEPDSYSGGGGNMPSCLSLASARIPRSKEEWYGKFNEKFYDPIDRKVMTQAINDWIELIVMKDVAISSVEAEKL